jgi:phage terminase small subunit
MPLSDKHARFVAEYLIDSNATQAAIRAGYSPKTAAAQASRLLRNVKVRAAVRRGQARVIAEAEVSAAATLRELGRVGYFDIGQVFRRNGDLIPIHQLPPAVRAGIASVEIVLKNATAGDDKIDRVLKIRTTDKVPALGLLARHFALLVDRVQVTGAVSLAEKIAAARRRGAQLQAERAGTKG